MFRGEIVCFNFLTNKIVCVLISMAKIWLTMASKPVKREAGHGWNVVFTKKMCMIHYYKCVICQEHAGKLNTIQKESWEKLRISSEDKTALLLHEDIQNDSWLEERKPLLYAQCRNWYILQKIHYGQEEETWECV